jgi:putative hydrolase of the HAD superfamily
LDELVEAHTLALLTDGYLPAQKLKVSALGIQRYFKHIIYTEQLGRQFWKPSPVGFEAIITATDAPPQSMVYVGDNPTKDFIAPNRLGMKTIQVQRPHRLHIVDAEAPEAQARLTLNALGDLPQALAQWNTQENMSISGTSPPL